ncbi:protein kinase [Dehalococcoidia bacterium]|nr:protein kinase [Dehalococcoidia bacterium]
MSKLKVLVAALAVIVLLPLPTAAFAQSISPAVFYGTAYVDNVPVAGATVSGWIDGVNVAETTTAGDGSYYLKVEGNFQGKTVFFKVAGYDALETATWEMGRIVLLDLHATKAPLPVMPGIPFVIFDGWYVDGSEVNTTSEDKTVTARITLQWGDPGRYRMRIRRDVAWGFDETVKELEFDYDGGVATKELSFQPPYATNENDTAGYHVNIQRYRLPLFTLLGWWDTVWTLEDAYPPRLKVEPIPLPPGNWIPYIPLRGEVQIEIIPAEGLPGPRQAKVTFSTELLPDAAVGVKDWGLIKREGNVFSVDAVIQQYTGIVILLPHEPETHIYELGIIQPGDYKFRFYANGNFVKEEPFVVDPGTGSLLITSEPPGAEVYLDDDFRGRAPLIIEELEPGSYELEVTLEGYEDWEKRVVVKAGKITSVLAELTALPPPHPAEFTTTDLTITPEEVFTGEEVTISALVANTGELAGTHQVILKIDGVVEATEEVTLDGGASQEVAFTVTKDTAGTYAVNIDGLTGGFVVRARPAEFTVISLGIAPAEVYTGKEVRISALVANIGELAGTHQVILKIDDAVEATQEITLDGGASREVSFTVTRDVAASYSVDVGGLMGTFVVRAVPPPPPPPSPGVTDITDVITPDGVFIDDVIAESFDGLVHLTIDQGTIGLINGKPLAEIVMVEMQVPPPPPEDTEIIGLVYDAGPDGATFNPPTTLTFTYDPALIPEGVAEENLVIALLDIDAGEWVELVSIVDPAANIITTQVSHFTTFTILAPLPMPAPTPLIPPGFLLPLIGILIAGALALFAVMMVRRKPKKKTPPEHPEDEVPPRGDEPPPYFPEKLLPFYDPIRLLGRGGFARVFEVIRKKDGLGVALKVPLDPEDPAIKESFRGEMGNWQRLKHGNIIQLREFATVPLPFLEMELGEESLERLKKPLEPDKAARLIFEVGRGLEYAHRQSVVHRDLKPSNILLKEGIPKISDWGLSRVKTESRTSSSKSLSPPYSAPEQHSPRKFGGVDERTDIFQLGIVLYELATGKLPFEGAEYFEIVSAIQLEEPVAPSIPNPEASRLEPVILKCLRKEKEERYQSVRELRKDLADFLRREYGIKLTLSRDSQNFKAAVGHSADLALISAEQGDFRDMERRLKEVEELARHGFPEKLAASVLHSMEAIFDLQRLCYEEREKRVRYGEVKQQYKVLCEFLSSAKFDEEVENDPDLGGIFKHFDLLYEEDDLLDYEGVERLKFFCDKLIKKWQAFFLRR